MKFYRIIIDDILDKLAILMSRVDLLDVKKISIKSLKKVKKISIKN